MTPCILPWINFCTNTFGRSRVCGYSSNKSNVKLKDTTINDEWNNEYFKSIRRDFLSGIWPENCKRCEYMEKLNGHSKKEIANATLGNVYHNLFALTAKDGSVPYSPIHIDVRTGTVCNLKCIHCGTGASSKWNEDKNLLNKYPNTEKYLINNKWIEQDTKFWDHLRSNMNYIKHYSFSGGESFANKQHNNFLKDLSNSKYAQHVTVSYTTNGTFMNNDILEQLNNFKLVLLRISIDSVDKQLEYYRFPIKWNDLNMRLVMINNFVKDKTNFEVGFQWSCSNISLFYLTNTYEFLTKNFSNIKFLFGNFVDFPLHMSAQNLPTELKQQITEKIMNYKFFDNSYKFYVDHMNCTDLWPLYGKTFFNYLDDIDKSRNLSWKETFSSMQLEKFYEG